MIKVGIVGCGLIGDVHLKLLKSMKNIRIVGIADRDTEKAKDFALRTKGAIFVGDLETLLERAKPDAVHILTPPFTHASLTCTALQAGCHVYLEKPMALTTQEAQSMVAAAAKSKRLLTVGHHNLFNPVVREAYQRVKDGYIGKLIGMNVFHGSLPIHAPWIYQLPSGPWFNDLDHLLYLSRLFMGDAVIARVVGFSAVDKSRVDELHVALRHLGGWNSLTYSTLAAPFQIRITLFGDKRTLELDLISEIMVALRSFDIHHWLNKGIMSIDVVCQIILQTGWQTIRVLAGNERGHSGHRSLIGAFYKAILEGTPSPVSLDHCLRIVEMKEEIRGLLKESE